MLGPGIANHQCSFGHLVIVQCLVRVGKRRLSIEFLTLSDLNYFVVWKQLGELAADQ